MQSYIQGIFNVLVFVVFLALLLKLIWYVSVNNLESFFLSFSQWITKDTRKLSISSLNDGDSN